MAKTKRERNHSIRHVRAAICRQPWAIYQPALAEMIEFLQARPDGDVESRFGIQAESDSRMEIVGGVAVIPITGVLQPKPNAVTRYYGGTATSQIETDFRRAVGDSQVKAIVFLVDSPGGAAMGNEEVARTIFAGRGQKPITSFVRGYAASAAYYIASAADRIVASPSSSVGSIGAILYHEDDSKLFDEFGIKITPLFFGKHKADGNPYEKLSAQSRKSLQDYVTGYGEQFAAAVAKHRGISVSDVMSRFGQGLVFLADESKRIGMVDEVGTFDAVLQQTSVDEPTPPENEESVTVTTVSESSGTEHDDADSQSEKPSAASAAVTLKRSPTMDKIKAALFARGLIDKIDESDEVCKAVLTGYFRGDVPDSEEKILEALNGTSTQEVAAGVTATVIQSAAAPAANVQAAHDNEIAEARAEARTEERQRVANIEASGKLLGMSAADIEAAIASEDSDKEIIAGWHRKLTEQEKPVDTGNVRVTGEGADQFATDAVDGLLLRSGYRAASEKLSREAEQLQGAPLAWIAQRCLQLSGSRVNQFATPEQVALDALQMGGVNLTVFSAGPAFNRPGDFPNLLSNLAGKMLDQALQIAEPTYPVWTARIADLPDFKPKTIIGVGNFDELDEIMDDEDPKSLQLDEEAAGWIQAGRYGNKIGLTPVMVANDDLDAFTQGLQSLAVAHETTLNRLCLAIITGNVSLLDGNALFDDTNHGNDIASGSGGVPSSAQANLMRLKHRRQTGIGGHGKVRTPPKIALVPTAHEEAAMQTFLTFSRLNESKLPVTDATINTFRGSIEPVVEPDLEDTSVLVWYTFADPRIRRVIVHAFQRGYGRGGKRTTWFDPGKETRYVKLEGRFAAAACGHRGAVRNAGA